MAAKTYPPEIKAGFIKAARDARASGRTWDQALTAAKSAGYSGSVGGLCQMLLRDDNKVDLPVRRSHSAGSVLVQAPAHQAPAVPTAPLARTMFEYKSAILPAQQPPDGALNGLGHVGWELVSSTPVGTALLEDGAHVTRVLYIFKRPVPHA